MAFERNNATELRGNVLGNILISNTWKETIRERGDTFGIDDKGPCSLEIYILILFRMVLHIPACIHE